MEKKIILAIVILLGVLYNANSQKTLLYEDADKLYRQGIELFNKEKYASAQECFRKVIDYYGNRVCDYKTDAEYYAAICAIELFHKDAEYQIINFIKENPGSPKIKQAYFQMGKFMYRNQKFKESLTWFEKVNTYDLTNEELSEYYFKIGYCYFVNDNLEKASKSFFEIKDVDNKYTIPAIYYYSHIAYLQKNYETALQGFLKISNQKTFEPIIPYYITQIYYLQKNYDKVIAYAPPYLENANTKRTPEMARIIADSYYRLAKYNEALPYFEKFLEKTLSVTREDYYQIGCVYYNVKNYKKAAEMFQKVTSINDTLSQNAYNFLADSYLKTDAKNNARLAFFYASKYDFNKEIKSNALLNYAKLTYELSVDPFSEAIQSFLKYIELFPNADNINEAYDYLSKAYLASKNYAEALKYLERLTEKNPQAQEAYQKVAFFRGIECYNNSAFEEAINLFDKSIQYGQYNLNMKALAMFWKAEAYYHKEDYNNTIKTYNDFLTQAGAFNLDEYKLAHYNQAYAYFKQKKYNDAITWFRKYIAIAGENKTRYLGDAYLRTADCYFGLLKYNDAIEYYEKASKIEKCEPDYALYQKGFIHGLINQNQQKIATLTQLINNYPESEYTDDAYFEIAQTYADMQENQQAITYCRKVIEKYPNSSLVQKSMLLEALLNMNMDKTEEAIALYKTIATKYQGTNSSTEALKSLKEIYKELNNINEYISFTENLGGDIRISAEEKDSLTYEAAEKVYMSGKYEQAKNQFNQYITDFPNGYFLTKAHYYKADCNYRKNEYNEALVSYKYVISQGKTDFLEASLVRVAAISYAEKDYKNALQYYSQLDGIAEVSANIQLAAIGKMRCNYYLNNYELAISSSDRVLGINKLDELLINEAHYIKAKSYLATGDSIFALDEFNVLSSAVNTKFGAEAKYFKALLLYKQKQYDAAEKEILEFAKVGTLYQYWLAKSFIVYGDIFVARGDDFQAKHTLMSVIDNYSDKTDGVVDEANAKLQAILLREKEQTKPKNDANIDINWPESPDGKYNETPNFDKN